MVPSILVRVFSRRRGRTPRFRPNVEVLEGRSLPSTFTVTDLGDAGAGSGLQGDLRYAINTANANGEPSNRIEFAPGLSGTITLTQGVLTVTKALDIDGPGQDLLTVSGDHQSGVFYIAAPAPQPVSLADLTIADGTGVVAQFTNLPTGGGVNSDNAVVTMSRCKVKGNSAYKGGGVFAYFSTMVLDSCTITGNQASNSGGGLDNYGNTSGGTMTVTGTTVSGNTAGLAGGIDNTGTMTFSDGAIADNAANPLSTTNGGGINNIGQMTVINTQITGNTSSGVFSQARMTLSGCTVADNAGGGVINYLQMVITRCTIMGNTGGPGLLASVNTVVLDSTIVNNTTSGDGGGVNFNELNGLLEIFGSTITDNVATSGGGIWVAAAFAHARLVIDTTIVAQNTALMSDPDVKGPVQSLGYNLIGQVGGSSGWLNNDQTGTADAPLDPMLGPLTDNGGPTPTRAPLLGSPAIDAGDPALSGSKDQRGSIRQAHTSRTDIGAVEAERIFSFRVTAPAQVAAGQPFALTVTALDLYGNVATTYPVGSVGATGTVHFTSSDPAAQLPDNYTFTAADQGVHTFTAALASPGDQTIQVADTGFILYIGAATVTVTENQPLARTPLGLAGISLSGAEGWCGTGHHERSLWSDLIS
jgi:hypothetical protein